MSKTNNQSNSKAYQQGFEDALSGKQMDDYFKRFDGYVNGYNSGKRSKTNNLNDQELIEELKQQGIEEYEVEGFILGMRDASAGKKRRRSYRTILGYAAGYDAVKNARKEQFDQFAVALRKLLSKPASEEEIKEVVEWFNELGNEDKEPDKQNHAEDIKKALKNLEPRLRNEEEAIESYKILKQKHKRKMKNDIQKKLIAFFVLTTAITILLIFLLKDKNDPWEKYKDSNLSFIPPDTKVDLMHFKRVSGRWGLYDHDDNVIIKPMYDSINTVNSTDGILTSEGALMMIGNKKGYVDQSGKETIPAIYDALTFYTNDSILHFKEHDLWGIIKRSGQILTQAKYKSIGDYYNGFAQVTIGNKIGVLNSNGIEVIEAKYDQLGAFNSEGIAWAVLKGNIILINNQGEILHTPYIEDLKSEDKGFRITSGGLFGFANRAGQMIIPCEFSTINAVDNGFYLEQEGNWGFSDVYGNKVVPCRYESINLQNSGYLVKNGDKQGFYDSEGKLVVPCKYTSLAFNDKGILVEDDGNYGLYSNDGKVIMPCIYDEIQFEGINLARVKLYNKFGWFDLNKKRIVIDIIYDECWGEFNHELSLVEVREGGRRYRIDYTGKEIEGKSITDKIKQWFN